MIELLTHGEVYAPEPLGVCHLAVCAGTVIWIGRDRPRIPPELLAGERDLAGRWVIPGLVDLHAHLGGGGGESGPASRVPPLGLSRFTAAGVTSVVGLLGTDTVTRSMADLVARTRALVDEGLSAWCWTGGYAVPPVTLTGSVRGDIVHIDRILGVGELALADHRSSQPTLDELLRVAADAHVAGLITGKAGVVHLHLGDGGRGLELVRRALEASELPPRVFHPTHVNRRRALFDEALELARRGSVIDVTAFPAAGGGEEIAAVTEEGEDGELAAQEAVLRYLDSGLPAERLTVSSDGGGCLPVFDEDGRVSEMDVGRPGALTETLAALLARGVPPERAVPPFTANPARLLRLAGKGRLEAGADADLVVLDPAGPRVTDVMARGRWYVENCEVVIRGAFE